MWGFPSGCLLILSVYIWMPAETAGQEVGEDFMSSCPTSQQLKSLVNPRKDGNLECFCSNDPSHDVGGWEITCLPTRNFRSINHTDVPQEDASEMYMAHASSLGFTVKFSQKKVMEIICDAAVPDFKPAFFQGPYSLITPFSPLFSLSQCRGAFSRSCFL